MLRCDCCDAKIDESQNHRTRFSMDMWCVDIRHHSIYESPIGRATAYADLCQPCQDHAFNDLEELATKYSCFARKHSVPVVELAQSLVDKEAQPVEVPEIET